ncbi:uncharacterized protein LOC103709222 isoform X2 [Phoenix dactylifera]|uniref:Uncharacterized protein LOC103709222 isoform X2 n=1 Tax=Phoenix dactylifera TaxID=42345 RepID=A0A8B7C6A6_PHODC|nr:uncharacterized protein LOC103709222 isoform X2 [Phoenix dactylifera]
MARDVEAGEASRRAPAQPPDVPSVRIRSRPDPLLIVCRCFSFLTAVIAVLCVVVNVLSAVQSFKNGSDIFGGIFRCYAVLIALFVAVAETEWSFIMKFWRIFEYWAGRGMLQIFVAVMTRAFPDVSGRRKDLILLQEIASYLLMACGLTYVISELERRREELEALLVVDRA